MHHAVDAVKRIEEALKPSSANNPDLTEETRNHGSLFTGSPAAGRISKAYEAAIIAGQLIAKTSTPHCFPYLKGTRHPQPSF